MALNLDNPVPTPPPQKRQPRTPKPPKETPELAERRLASRQESLEGLFKLAATGCLLAGQTADAGACFKHGPPISHEVAELAEDNEQVAKLVDWLTHVGPYAGVIAAVLPFGLQIWVNHNPSMAGPLAGFGVTDPATLDMQARAKALEDYATAAEEAAKAQEQYEQAAQRSGLSLVPPSPVNA